MPKVAKIPEKVYLVVTEVKWAKNQRSHQTVKFYTSEGQARGERTRQINAMKNRNPFKDPDDTWTCLIYVTTPTWELHPDTEELGLQTLLEHLEKS